MSETSIISEPVDAVEVEGKELWPRAGAYLIDSLARYMGRIFRQR